MDARIDPVPPGRDGCNTWLAVRQSGAWAAGA